MYKFLIAMLVFAPNSGGAASDAISLACTIIRSCDTAANCSPKGGQVNFDFTPENVNDIGEGVYRLTTGNIETVAFFFSEAGPIVWSRGSEDVQTMAITGKNSIVWTDARFGTAARSTTYFLTCEGL